MKSKSIVIEIDVEPTAKGRPRVTFQNGKVRTYTPEHTKQAEDAVLAEILAYKQQMFPPHVPLILTATFFREKSRWLPVKETLPFRKPDMDNFLKLLLDAMNGVLVPDDAQITTMHLRKRWSTNFGGYITIKLEEDKGG